MTTPLEEAKALRKEEAFDLCTQKMAGGIDYTDMSTVFSSALVPSTRFGGLFASAYSPNALISYQIAGTVPIGFTAPDIDGNFVVVTLAQLLNLNTGLVDLHYLCRFNGSFLCEAIDALTTVEDVEDFDITTGWPTIPHVI